MDVIIETDIGGDPDDILAICYLAATGLCNIRGILVNPGHKDQVAIAKFLVHEFGIPYTPVVASRPSGKVIDQGPHIKLMKKYGWPLEMEPDDEDEMYIDGNLSGFIIGPCTGIVRHLYGIYNVVMQGGFCPYSIYRPEFALSKFENKLVCPTFNLNGDLKAAASLINENRPNLSKTFVGKNVCHAMELTWEHLERVERVSPKNRAAQLFVEALALILEKHDAKKAHDPVAAVCMLHPEVGTYYQGEPYCSGNKWGTKPTGNKTRVCVDLDREAVFEHLCNLT